MSSAAVCDVIGPDGHSYRRPRRRRTSPLPPPLFEPVVVTVTRLHPKGRQLLETILELDRFWLQVREVPASVTSNRTVWRVIDERDEQILLETPLLKDAVEFARTTIAAALGPVGGMIAVMPEQQNRTPGDGTLPNYLAEQIIVLNRTPAVDPCKPLDVWLEDDPASNVANSTLAVGHLPSRTHYGFLLDTEATSVETALRARMKLHAWPRLVNFKDDPMNPFFQVRIAA